MSSCRDCGQEIGPAKEPPALRAGVALYHVRCAPNDLLDAAAEEYRAIVKKGVRYFAEKYGVAPVREGEVTQLFLALGSGIEEERGRRGSR